MILGCAERLEAAGVGVTRGHWRPRVFGGGGTAGGADDPHGQAPRGALSSILKLGWLWFHWWAGWWKFPCLTCKDRVMLFDRYHADLLVDPLRYRYGGPLWLARLASRWMPQPDLVIFLDAPPEVLLARKQEVSSEALAHARAKYRDLVRSHPRFQTIDASRPLEQVLDEVVARIESRIPPQVKAE